MTTYNLTSDQFSTINGAINNNTKLYMQLMGEPTYRIYNDATGADLHTGTWTSTMSSGVMTYTLSDGYGTLTSSDSSISTNRANFVYTPGQANSNVTIPGSQGASISSNLVNIDENGNPFFVSKLQNLTSEDNSVTITQNANNIVDLSVAAVSFNNITLTGTTTADTIQAVSITETGGSTLTDVTATTINVSGATTLGATNAQSLTTTNASVGGTLDVTGNTSVTDLEVSGTFSAKSITGLNVYTNGSIPPSAIIPGTILGFVIPAV